MVYSTAAGQTSDYGNAVFFHISAVDFTNSIQKIYDDSESIQKILSEIATGKRTEKQSIQDYPSAEEYGTINIENNGGMTTMFYYEENGKYYIECPYKGIYEIENNFEDMI